MTAFRTIIRNTALTAAGIVALASTLFLPTPVVQPRVVYCNTPEVGFKVKVDSENPNPNALWNIYETLERVPDPIQRRVNEYGGKLVIVDDVEIVRDRFSTEYDVERNKVLPVAGFITKNREAIIPQTSPTIEFHQSKNPLSLLGIRPKYTLATRDTIEGAKATALHEYGHLVDRAFEISTGLDFANLYKGEFNRFAGGGVKLANPSELYGLRNKSEYFATMFAIYFSGNKDDRSHMRNSYPETLQYFQSFEREALSKCPIQFKNLKVYEVLGR